MGKEEKYVAKYAPVKSITIKSTGTSKRVLARIMHSLNKGGFENMLNKVEELPQTIKVNLTAGYLYDTCIDDLETFDVEYTCQTF